MADSDDKKQARLQQEAEMDEVFKSEQTTIIPVDLDGEMKKSFIDYAMSVISDRALPDIRDGLKPVHRRILYSMFTQGFTPEKPYRYLKGPARKRDRCTGRHHGNNGG